MPNRGEFRATTDHLLALIDTLRGFEEAKRSAELGSPEFVRLAQDAAEQGRLIFRWTEMQLQMAQDVARRREMGEQERDVLLIDVTPRPLDRILAQWREAQIRLEIARPGSAEAGEAAAAIERLRDEYQVAHAAVASGTSGGSASSASAVPIDQRAQARG
jgi:hypothetical protein